MTRPNGMPEDTPDYMAPAWLSALRFALSDQRSRAKFFRDTGNRITGPQGDMAAFVSWFNVNVWGPMHGPEDEE